MNGISKVSTYQAIYNKVAPILEKQPEAKVKIGDRDYVVRVNSVSGDYEFDVDEPNRRISPARALRSFFDRGFSFTTRCQRYADGVNSLKKLKYVTDSIEEQSDESNSAIERINKAIVAEVDRLIPNVPYYEPKIPTALKDDVSLNVITSLSGTIFTALSALNTKLKEELNDRPSKNARYTLQAINRELLCFIDVYDAIASLIHHSTTSAELAQHCKKMETLNELLNMYNELFIVFNGNDVKSSMSSQGREKIIAVAEELVQ